MKSGSNLEKLLTAGHFVVTGECGPPRNADDKVIREKAGHLKGCVDSVNMTDNQTSVVRMSLTGREPGSAAGRPRGQHAEWSAGTGTASPCSPISWAPTP